MSLNKRIQRLEEMTPDPPAPVIRKLQRVVKEGLLTYQDAAERWPNLAQRYLQEYRQ